ncbi:MAG: hypothetical protein ACN6QC_10100, partial [Paraburkholderia hospita]
HRETVTGGHGHVGDAGRIGCVLGQGQALQRTERAHIGVDRIMGRRACSKRMKRLLQSGADRAGSRAKTGLLKAVWKLGFVRGRRD